MKKLFKKKPKKLSDYKFKINYDPRLDTIDPATLAPQKLAEANESLSKLKLPKELL